MATEKTVLKTPQEIVDAFIEQKDPELINDNGQQATIDRVQFGTGWPEITADGFHYRLFDETTHPEVSVSAAVSDDDSQVPA